MKDFLPHRIPEILIVDDQQINLELIKGMLGDDYIVHFAKSGNEALEFCEKNIPDLVLMDLVMDGMDGIETCLQLKAHDDLKNIPVIFLTVEIDAKSEEQCFNAGAIDFLNKPVSENSLRNRIKAHIALKFQSDILRDLAFKDGLTGIYNRYYLDDQLSRQFTFSKRNKEPFALIILDIDYFKKFNDTYGHLEGDKCLKMIAMALQSAIFRPMDFVARYGGEEFVILLSGLDRVNLEKILPRILESIKRLEIKHEGSPHKTVSASCGAVVLSPEFTDVKEMLKAADDALYEAKGKGRNCYVIH